MDYETITPIRNAVNKRFLPKVTRSLNPPQSPFTKGGRDISSHWQTCPQLVEGGRRRRPEPCSSRQGEYWDFGLPARSRFGEGRRRTVGRDFMKTFSNR